MLSGTVLAIIFVPLFFVLVRRLFAPQVIPSAAIGLAAINDAHIAKIMAEITAMNRDDGKQGGPAQDSSADEFAAAKGGKREKPSGMPMTFTNGAAEADEEEGANDA